MIVTLVIIIVVIIILLGVIVFPLVNRKQLKNMPYDQQIRILMKQANKLIYFKNISNGSKGTLVYIKNKRKILFYPWTLIDGKMICTKNNVYDHWDYPEEEPAFTQEEINQAKEELEKFNKKLTIKIYLPNED